MDPYIPISFGFDTACRTYSELIGNLGQDTLGSQKYYHFVRLMGRAASNIALECALQTRPNVCLISEEVEQKKMTLSQITQEVVKVIVDRAAAGKDYGIVLLPEGLIEFIPEFNALISEINDVLATGVDTTEAAVVPHLSFNNKAVFAYLPDNIKVTPLDLTSRDVPQRYSLPFLFLFFLDACNHFFVPTLVNLLLLDCLSVCLLTYSLAVVFITCVHSQWSFQTINQSTNPSTPSNNSSSIVILTATYKSLKSKPKNFSHKPLTVNWSIYALKALIRVLSFPCIIRMVTKVISLPLCFVLTM